MAKDTLEASAQESVYEMREMRAWAQQSTPEEEALH
jgi:hypothetical protein